MTKPLLWWKLPVPPKIRVFMWLVSKNRILIKHNLQKRGWTGNFYCHFCGMAEEVDHLFLSCTYSKTVWFWMGQCQDFFTGWHSMSESDIVTFALTLKAENRSAFLIVVSAVCWSIWKHRN